MTVPPTAPPIVQGWPRALLRALLLAVICGLLQALQPAYMLGPEALVPLGLCLGVATTALLARGPLAFTGAVLGALGGALFAQRTGGWTGAPVLGPMAAVVHVALLALQALLAAWLLRRSGDAGALQLDDGRRLRRLVLLAAPAAALLGAASHLAITTWPSAGLPGDAGWRPALAHAAGRLVVDWAGLVIVLAVALCWLAHPIAPWRPRRRLVAWPLLAALAVMLTGLDQVARRDERRLEVRFEQESVARQRQLQRLLAEPVAAVDAARGMLAAGGPGLAPTLFDGQAAGWAARVPGLRALGWLEAGAAPAVWALVHARAEDEAALAGLRSPGNADASAMPEAVRQAADRALAADAPLVLRLDPSPGTTGLLLLLQRVPGDAAPRRRIAFGVVDLPRQLDPALPEIDDPDLRVCVFDNPPASPRADVVAAMATPMTVLAGPPACAQAPAAGAFRTHAGRLALADRPMALLSVEPPTAGNRLFTAVWLLGLPTMVGLALLATLLLAVTGRLRRIEDRVAERTAALQTEIDERRQAERLLSQSEQRFRAIFESVNIGVTLVDDAGVIRMANPAFCAMMGCGTEALVGRPLAEVKLPDVAEDDGTAQALGGGQARRQRYLTPDGRVLQVAASLRTLHDITGAPVGTVGALHDLTQVLRLREAERERDEAEVANRTKSEFLARLSDELRAPLNAIVAFAQMVDDSDAANEATPRLQRTLANIRQTGWHLLDMVNDVLDLSRMEAGTLRLALGPVALAEVTQEAMAMLGPNAAAAGVELRLSLSPQAEWVLADAVRLRQVLVNLVGNAIKYNRHGGWVELRTRPGGVGEVLVEVEDTGVGIAPEQTEALFRPFHRLGRTRDAVPGTVHEQGTGIGLVICRKLAALMGGGLEVASRPGEGSVFSLRLARASGPSQGRSEVQATSALASQVSIGQVLYIEDSATDIEAMRQLLAARPGVSLRAVSSAAEGLARAGEADLVLLDLDLPDRPGLEVLLMLRGDTRMKGLPVIVVSAETRPDRIDQCFDAGATAFFSKPLDPAPLLRALDEALQRL